VRGFFLTLVAVIAALVMLALACCGGICGGICDMAERAASRLDRLVRWLKEPIK
jgi:sulfite exporter TauE/SafE